MNFFQLPYWRLIPITIIYAVMFITGVIGNILVCFVIVHNKSMHTATNYYLFSLAIADLIILLLGKKYIFLKAFPDGSIGKASILLSGVLRVRVPRREEG